MFIPSLDQQTLDALDQAAQERDLAAAFGVDPAAAGDLQPPPDEQFAPSGADRFFEQLAGLQVPQNLGRGFGAGLLGGLATGAATRGQRVASARQKFEQGQTQRRAAYDAAARQATADYRKEKGRLITEREKSKREAGKGSTYVDERLVKQFPMLADWQGQQIPNEQFNKLARPAPATPEEGLAPELSTGGLDLAARQYATMGSLPPMGMGKAGVKVRQKIINRAAEMFPNLDLASNVSGYQSDKASLTNIKRIHDASKAFAETADKNAKVLEETMVKIPNANSPWLNQPFRLVSRKGLGSADLAAYETARATVVPEFARLLSSPTASGQLTDTARKEMEDIVNGNYSLNQMRRVIAVLRRDAKNRTQSYEDQIKEIEGRISGRGRTSDSAPLSDEEAYQEYLRATGGR